MLLHPVRRLRLAGAGSLSYRSRDDWGCDDSRVQAMRVKLTWCVLGLGLAGAGCGLITDGARNAVSETSLCLETAVEGVRYRSMADAAWRAVVQEQPAQSCS